jgi:hypothetical protein
MACSITGNKMSDKHLSTTALAKSLNKESKELFILLAQGGWIIKVDGHWQLTEKGKFEGGIYINHPKYGEYIAWPDAVKNHPLLKLLPEAPLSATHIGQKWDLPARLVNLILAERGLIKKYLHGWLLTDKGADLGGQQHEAEQSGIPYVTWPESLLQENWVEIYLSQIHAKNCQSPFRSLDGHLVESQIQLRIDNWLYLAGIPHAHLYPIEIDNKKVTADFYLPNQALCLESWADSQSKSIAQSIMEDLDKQKYYRDFPIAFIEIGDESITQLDERLARELLKRGTAVY